MSTFDTIRMQFILEKNKFNTNLQQARRDLSTNTTAMRANLFGLTNTHTQGFQAMTDQVPGLGQALNMLKNPYAVAASGAIAVGVALNEAANKAAQFETNFRLLKNLNLDKTITQYRDLKNAIKDTAFAGGFNMQATTTGYFDVQSITGKYGREVDSIVRRQGQFAQLVGADFNQWLAGTAKAMANYGFGDDQLTRFNQSAYATYKSGYIDLNQLSQVMSVYAGSAASAKQDFNTANKMLALFTIKTKSSDEAATLTKSLFNDFTKKSTIDSLAKIGINMYDANKQLRQADDILLQLNSKFRTLKNDTQITNLKNQFTGSEGLIAYIQAATDQTGKMVEALQNFDNSKLDINRLHQNAAADYNLQLQQLKNRYETLMSEVGDAILPIKIAFLQSLTELGAGLRTITTSPTWQMLITPAKSREQQWTEWESTRRHYDAMPARQAAADKRGASPYHMPENPFSTTRFYNPLTYNHLSAPSPLRSNITPPPAATPLTGGAPIPGVTAVTDSAHQARNITVHIGALNQGGINTQNTNLQHMQPVDIENWFNDMCHRLIRNIEMM